VFGNECVAGLSWRAASSWGFPTSIPANGDLGVDMGASKSIMRVGPRWQGYGLKDQAADRAQRMKDTAIHAPARCLRSADRRSAESFYFCNRQPGLMSDMETL
jgi:hypothetical protein